MGLRNHPRIAAGLVLAVSVVASALFCWLLGAIRPAKSDPLATGGFYFIAVLAVYHGGSLAVRAVRVIARNHYDCLLTYEAGLMTRALAVGLIVGASALYLVPSLGPWLTHDDVGFLLTCLLALLAVHTTIVPAFNDWVNGAPLSAAAAVGIGTLIAG
jgi:hypothetical protein